MVLAACVLLPLAAYLAAPRCALDRRSAHAAVPRSAPALMAETVLVTDGTDSFYGSRSVFQVCAQALALP